MGTIRERRICRLCRNYNGIILLPPPYIGELSAVFGGGTIAAPNFVHLREQGSRCTKPVAFLAPKRSGQTNTAV